MCGILVSSGHSGGLKAKSLALCLSTMQLEIKFYWNLLHFVMAKVSYVLETIGLVFDTNIIINANF